MSYVTAPVVPFPDASGLATTMMSAMYGDPYWAANFRDTHTLPMIIAGCTDRLPFNLLTDREHRRYLKAVETTTGTIVGHSRWIVPEGWEDRWLEAMVAEPTAEESEEAERLYKADRVWAEGLKKEKVERFGMPLEAAMDELRKDGEFVEIDYLTVHPAHQRKGIGALLVAAGLAEVDRWGMKCVVMAKAGGVRLYEQHGFEVVKTVVQDDSEDGPGPDRKFWFMVRMPRKK